MRCIQTGRPSEALMTLWISRGGSVISTLNDLKSIRSAENSYGGVASQTCTEYRGANLDETNDVLSDSPTLGTGLGLR